MRLIVLMMLGLVLTACIPSVDHPISKPKHWTVLSGRDPGRLFTEINQIIEDMHATGKLKELSLYYQGADFTQEAALYTVSALTQLP